MISPGICASAKHEFLCGVHQPGDDYRMALYTAQASLSPTTAAYTPQGETAGVGYNPGGRSLAGYRSGVLDGHAFLDWEDPKWPAATITARGALIYNASKQNRALVVLDFGAQISSTNGPFVVELPPPGSTAVVCID